MSMLASLLSSGIQKDWSQQDKKKKQPPCDELYGICSFVVILMV